ncbi:phosphatidate cytidylyltransferase [bacterium]|nr:phosphatidate cytidylyltransferase [bacterium]
MFLQRLLTAVVAAPAALALIWFGTPWAVAAVVALIVLLCAEEWARLAQLDGSEVRFVFRGLIVAGMFVMYGVAVDFSAQNLVLGLGVFWWLLAAIWLRGYPAFFADGKIPQFPAIVVGALVLLPAFLGILTLHEAPGDGPLRVFLLLILIWAADTGAYFAGHQFGKHKLAPRISPGKTIEGAVGGMLTAALVAIAGGLWVFGLAGATLFGFVLLCLVVAGLSIVGDLTISMFKRQADVKDTGAILPGHGGALDRLDSVLAASPALALGLRLLGI